LHDHNNATAPAECGLAIDVPVYPQLHPFPGTDEHTLTAGADMFGFVYGVYGWHTGGESNAGPWLP
jgi:hypothetical protein